METLGAIYRKTFGNFSDSIAVCDEYTSYTYAQLKERSFRLANALISFGLKKGDRVAILASNRIEHIELEVAAALAGLIKVPLNYRLHPREHEYMLQHSGASILLGEDNLIEIIDVEIPTIRFGIEYESWIADFPDIDPNVEINEDDVITIMYTSGTTGRPKGAMQTHRNWISCTLSLIKASDMSDDDVVGHVAPLTHGSLAMAYSALFLGIKQIIFNKFEPQQFLEAIESERITAVFLVPTMVNLMIHEESLSKRDLSSLRTINMAGAPMAAEKIKLAIDLLGPIILETYGQAEAPLTITVMPKDELKDWPSSCGKVGIFTEMKIVDKYGQEVPAGTIGEIICNGSLVMKGYWNNPKATSETIKDGWLYTGDLGWVDEKGYLHIVDRSKDVIISGGANIYPREVEEVLNLHPGVKETCVFGIPDEKWGESVCAYIVPRNQQTVSEQELIDLCKNHLASFKKPKKICIMDCLPKNSYGKILRKEIRDSYWGSRI
ncbi:MULTISPECIES: class I adenylate-forming enzyme family protein [unclassified Cytobacillus]|uniref:class I adenylate-forming enzyme family protein n=1 Tax=unclassified Cytobacillus TaxID=2675268 RepID=UPI00135934F7|nr:long-chain fatty acid--CoA ligase [Cytobacillus sp. AMY 15.2]KAF0817711.1 Long-chain-fatty-acid--CoA ligase [Bacillus sp. ZZV12-4809]MCM3093731.1 long-chain fatty acid--CoA ligase [Cytobacillus sp. AMY 15.2]